MLAHPEFIDAVKLAQLITPLGILGDTILDNLSLKNDIFRVKHSFFVHTLEDEILLQLLDAIKSRNAVTITVKSTRSGRKNDLFCIPLCIYVSTRTGRRYLRFYEIEFHHLSCARLDAIKKIVDESKSKNDKQNKQVPDDCPSIEQLLCMESESRSYTWGVSSRSKEHPEPSHIRLTLHIDEAKEDYVRSRLEREGKNGTITRIAENIFTYETDVYDVHEMLPWIRTFTGRIVNLSSDDEKIEQLFKKDIQTMHDLYFETGET